MMINGYRIIPTAYITKKVLAKHPKKKSNRRWMKKYWKKYTKDVPDTTSVTILEKQKVMLCHPILAKQLQETDAQARRVAAADYFWRGVI